MLQCRLRTRHHFHSGRSRLPGPAIISCSSQRSCADQTVLNGSWSDYCFQVLDSPATSALKAACEDKPKAASVTLVCARFSKMTGWGGRGVEDSVEREWSGGRRKRPQHDDAVIVWQGTKSSDPWILTGPTAFSGKDFSRMVRAELYPLPLHSISCA